MGLLDVDTSTHKDCALFWNIFLGLDTPGYNRAPLRGSHDRPDQRSPYDFSRTSMSGQEESDCRKGVLAVGASVLRPRQCEWHYYSSTSSPTP